MPDLDLFYVAESNLRLDLLRGSDSTGMQAGIRRLRILRRRGVPLPPALDVEPLSRLISSRPGLLAAFGRAPTADPELAGPSAAEIASMAEVVAQDRDSRAVYAPGEKAARVAVLRRLAATVAAAELASGGPRLDNPLAGMPERLAEVRRRNDALLATISGERVQTDERRA
jgi:hypothetical protein